MLIKKLSSYRFTYFLYLFYNLNHFLLMKHADNLLILYDGNCPLCCAKRDFLQRRDHQKKLTFSDIRSNDFQSLEIPVPLGQLEKEIHCITPDGQILQAMDVIRAAYTRIGLGWLIAPTRWPLLKPGFDHLYQWVAENRLRISKFSIFSSR
ncbi:DUF393 domain-containing protein [Pontiellaceae bacterium B12227]|nr:DUF393 domain-containing protein [Pontiellaceae bacterium B12227]